MLYIFPKDEIILISHNASISRDSEIERPIINKDLLCVNIC